MSQDLEPGKPKPGYGHCAVCRHFTHYFGEPVPHEPNVAVCRVDGLMRTNLTPPVGCPQWQCHLKDLDN